MVNNTIIALVIIAVALYFWYNIEGFIHHAAELSPAQIDPMNEMQLFETDELLDRYPAPKYPLRYGAANPVVSEGCPMGPDGVCKDRHACKSMCHKLAGNNCRIPSESSHKCWLNEYQNCSYRMGHKGAYRQCTNNNTEAPNNIPCKCNNRSFDMCRPSDKASEKCYNSVYYRCMQSCPKTGKQWA